jgi:hypothetical protein
MSKRDYKNLGSVYGDMLNQVKRKIVKEGKKMEIGEAPLEDGGPSKDGGFEEAEADPRKLKNKKGKENMYNLDKLSYPDHLEEDKEDDTENEDEKHEEGKKSKESEKIAMEGLNNFMKQKSIFDKLYNKVMISESYDEMEETDDLDALGIDDATPDDELGEEGDSDVTITMDRATAQQLCDLIQAALGDEDEFDMEGEDMGEDMGEEGGFDSFDGEEDEEGAPTAMSTSYNDGKHNKVGNLKPKGRASATGATGKIDPGSSHSGSYNDGKQNKVGNLKTGQGAFE